MRPEYIYLEFKIYHMFIPLGNYLKVLNFFDGVDTSINLLFEVSWRDNYKSNIKSILGGGGGNLRGGGIEEKGKRTHGHGLQCGHCWVEGSIRELTDNGKNSIKILKSVA